MVATAATAATAVAAAARGRPLSDRDRWPMSRREWPHWQCSRGCLLLRSSTFAVCAVVGDLHHRWWRPSGEGHVYHVVSHGVSVPFFTMTGRGPPEALFAVWPWGRRRPFGAAADYLRVPLPPPRHPGWGGRRRTAWQQGSGVACSLGKPVVAVHPVAAVCRRDGGMAANQSPLLVGGTKLVGEA